MSAAGPPQGARPPQGERREATQGGQHPPSIRRTLVVWLTAGLALVLVTAAVLTYVRARNEANALFDLQLRQAAASIIGMPIAGGSAFQGAAGDDGLVVQIWDRQGVRVYQSRAPTSDERMPGRGAPGFATIDTPSGPYRVFSVLANAQIVQVGQPLAVRSELAARLALSTILPLAVVTPLIALLVWFAVRKGLAPLDRVADAVQKRSAGQLAPLRATGWPREVEPLVGALNGLLGRLEHAIDAQRAFVADAAHELRTPLAALALQAQLAERAVTTAARDQALTELRGGLTRATRMVEQLLTLAREEPDLEARPSVPVALAPLARDAVASLAPLAAAKSIDVGVVHADETARVQGDPDALATLVANLVDNAIRYTPAGGRVDAGIVRDRDGVVLAIRDNGPGIPAAERERVFERFARGHAETATGSGLGLAIVKRIAKRHGASVELAEGLDDQGVGVLVRFAPADASPADRTKPP